ncbi:DUF11 domain-containing protein [Sunxiuqinia dokdonensis]|nr:DUF11 domain-containing protein [Sunxiuqinia dokdonensis]
MKKRDLNTRATKMFSLSLLVVLVFFVTTFSVFGQVRVPFTQRTSPLAGGKKIYSIKGDFAMVGNTNLSLWSYDPDENNSNNYMAYVDVDGDSKTLNSSSATLAFSTENGAIPECSNIVFAGLYWTGRAHDGSSSPNTFTVTKGGVTKNYDKRVVSLKGPGATNYQTITANADDIYYPTNSDGYMYSAYAEVTEYVRQHGVGDYFVADMALREGDGGSTGYYGGWGMIVVYENTKMKWRDVTVFDGHAYVQGSTTISHTLDVSGFNTVQSGDVNMKLGLMAGEGDRSISGDYFDIRNHNNTSWVRLSHGGNSTDNFFNSSVYTGGNSRNPSLTNNTGLDIAMFDIPNADNAVIKNNQTSTSFRYGSTQDTYIIFCMAMAVDAYIPEAEVETGVKLISNPSTEGYVVPGENITIGVDIRNKGTEAIHDALVTIPIPFNVNYVSHSAAHGVVNLQNDTLYWNIDDLLVLPGDPDEILASLSITLQVRTDCHIFINPCTRFLELNGSVSGTGATSFTSFSGVGFVHYVNEGPCIGIPVFGVQKIPIDADLFLANNCGSTVAVSSVTICSGAGTSQQEVINEAHLPANSSFYTVTDIQGVDPIVGDLPVPGIFYVFPPGIDDCWFEIELIADDGQGPQATGSLSSIIEEGCSVSDIPAAVTSVSALETMGVAISDEDTEDVNLVVTSSDSGATGPCPIVVSRTYTISDECGNSLELVQTITIRDNTAPTFTAPADVTIYTDADCNYDVDVAFTGERKCHRAFLLYTTDPGR